MSTSQKKLYGPKQIGIIAVSFLAGIGFTLFRRFHDIGRLEQTDFIVAGISVIVTSAIAVVIVRKANKEE